MNQRQRPDIPDWLFAVIIGLVLLAYEVSAK